jgi:hypothetical protein
MSGKLIARVNLALITFLSPYKEDKKYGSEEGKGNGRGSCGNRSQRC